MASIVILPYLKHKPDLDKIFNPISHNIIYYSIVTDSDKSKFKLPLGNREIKGKESDDVSSIFDPNIFPVLIDMNPAPLSSLEGEGEIKSFLQKGEEKKKDFLTPDKEALLIELAYRMEDSIDELKRASLKIDKADIQLKSAMGIEEDERIFGQNYLLSDIPPEIQIDTEVKLKAWWFLFRKDPGNYSLFGTDISEIREILIELSQQDPSFSITIPYPSQSQIKEDEKGTPFINEEKNVFELYKEIEDENVYREKLSNDLISHIKSWTSIKEEDWNSKLIIDFWDSISMEELLEMIFDKKRYYKEKEKTKDIKKHYIFLITYSKNKK